MRNLFAIVSCLFLAVPAFGDDNVHVYARRLHVYNNPTNATAQGVAELCAREGRCRHFGGNRGYEGVGVGSTPEQALGNCCFSRSGMRVVDQGVARGTDGRWYAARRYR